MLLWPGGIISPDAPVLAPPPNLNQVVGGAERPPPAGQLLQLERVRIRQVLAVSVMIMSTWPGSAGWGRKNVSTTPPSKSAKRTGNTTDWISAETAPLAMRVRSSARAAAPQGCCAWGRR